MDAFKIKDRIGEAAVLEQLAEECAELAQAALKMARIERGENPTPVTMKKATKNLLEEIADVHVCLNVLGVEAILSDESLLITCMEKMCRWDVRLQERGKNSEINGEHLPPPTSLYAHQSGAADGPAGGRQHHPQKLCDGAQGPAR